LPVLGMEPQILSFPFGSLITVQNELPQYPFQKDGSWEFKYCLHRPHVFKRSLYLVKKESNKQIHSYSIITRGHYSIRDMKL